VKKMRGKPNTEVKLTVLRKGEAQPLEFVVRRDVIKVKSVKAKMLEPGYGMIRITQFQEHTGENLVVGAAGPLQAIGRRHEGPGARPARQPRRAAEFRGGRVRRVPAEERAGGLHRRPHRGREDAPHRDQGKLRARRLQGRLPLARPRGREDRSRWWCS
jgi:hypothetical protein